MDETDFFRGAFQGDAEVVAQGLASGLDPNGANAKGMTPLILAIWGGKGEKVVELLLRRGVDLAYRQPSNGWRALTYAAVNGHDALLDRLLQAGDSVGPDDWKALHYAVEYRSYGGARELLRRGIDPDCRDEEGRTPLMRAAAKSSEEGVALMLDAGADPNLRDAEGRTPLHLAAGRANEKNVRRLLDAGADPALQDKDGRTPLEVARQAKRAKIVRLLEGISA